MTQQFDLGTSKIDAKQSAINLMSKAVNVKDAIVNIMGTTGISGFKFHILQSEQINLESDITDHYVDSNTPVQDHIARKPVIITVSGYQGEYFYTVHPIQTMLSKVASTLKLIDSFKPKLSDATKQIKEQWQKNQEALANTKIDYNEAGLKVPLKEKVTTSWQNFNDIDLFKYFQNLYKLKSRQTQAYYFFKALWNMGVPFSLETRWERYDNMLIQQLRPLGDNTADMTDFSITFKQINITSTQATKIKNAAGRLKEQIAKTTEKGVDKGQE
ncbi:MAG: hypothetical protein K2H20_04415, partial [Bacilli bacterium]|nr:hypothetical protein [Bacilli bacterium]